MATPELAFLTNDAGEEEGLGHSGIETYKDTPYPSVARECGQNTADAMATSPAQLKFDLINIPMAEYPPHAEHLAAINACLDKARKNNDEKEIDFFVRARDVLSGQQLKILRISDYNTTGLIGPAEPGTPFHSLVKAAGVSQKNSNTSGGSFGIGKNAAFAVSELQTVFYSTVYREETTKQEEFLAQGKTILISHTTGEGKRCSARGYWGLPGFQPVSAVADVPKWMRRDSVGTSVFVIGFREAENWQLRIAASVLQNFFCAVHRGTLEFEINNGGIKINRQTLALLFRDPSIINAANDSDTPDEFDFARDLLECLTSGEAAKKEVEIGALGRISISTLVRERLPKRVCIVRNGMAITDNLATFGDKFAVFPLYQDFVTLVEPAGPQGSAFIKRLENPRHDALSSERLSDSRKRAEATRDMKRLAKEVRDAIKEQALVKPVDEVPIDELSEFFADTDQNRERDTAAEDDPQTFTYERVARREPKTQRDAPGRAGYSGGAGRTGGQSKSGDRTRGPGAGRGTGGQGQAGGEKAIDLQDFRNVLAADGGTWNRRLYFSANQTGAAVLTLRATGLDRPEQLTIVGADQGVVKDGRLIVDLTPSNRFGVNVKLSDKYSGPVELTAAAISGGQ